MQHADHVNLIRGGVTDPGGVWADFGSGSGAFTLALAELVGPSGEIYSIDRQRGSLDRQAAAMRSSFPAVRVHYLAADFTQTLDLPALDGALMANSLHFMRDKEASCTQDQSLFAPRRQAAAGGIQRQPGQFCRASPPDLP